MNELKPTRVIPVEPPNNPSHPTERSLNLSGAPMPEDLRSMVLNHFDIDANPEDMEVVYQYILHKSPSAELDDIKTTIEAIASKLEPNKQELFHKIRDMAINELQLSNPHEMVQAKRDIIEKEMPGLERQAQQNGDWRFYLRASQKKDELGAISDISE